MSNQTRKLLERRKQMWDRRDPDIADEIFAQDMVSRDPDDVQHGVGEIKEKVRTIQQAFSDLKMDYYEIVATDDRVAYQWTISGTHTGPFEGVQPTHRKVEFSGSVIARVEDGKFVEEWVQLDKFGLMAQLGALEEGHATQAL